MNEAASALCFAMIMLIPLAALGLALMHTGLTRSRSAAHTMLAALCIMATAALAYFACGFCWQGAAGDTAGRGRARVRPGQFDPVPGRCRQHVGLPDERRRPDRPPQSALPDRRPAFGATGDKFCVLVPARESIHT